MMQRGAIIIRLTQSQQRTSSPTQSLQASITHTQAPHHTSHAPTRTQVTRRRIFLILFSLTERLFENYITQSIMERTRWRADYAQSQVVKCRAHIKLTLPSARKK